MNYEHLIYQWDTGINIKQPFIVRFGLKKSGLNDHMCISLDMPN